MEIFHQLKSDALRTFLSLAGVSVGIFVVIVSLVLVDAFQSAVVAGFDHFGSDMVMVERFPVVSEEGDDAWRSYAARPMPSYADFQALSGGLTGSLEASDREGRRSGGSLCAGESAAAAGSQSGAQQSAAAGGSSQYSLQSAAAAGSQSGGLQSAAAGGSSQYSLQSAAAAGSQSGGLQSAAAGGSSQYSLQSAAAAGSQSGGLQSAAAGGSSQYSLQSAAAAGSQSGGLQSAGAGGSSQYPLQSAGAAGSQSGGQQSAGAGGSSQYPLQSAAAAGKKYAATGSPSGALQSAAAAGSQSGAQQSAGARGSSQYPLQSAAAAGKKYAAAGSAASAEGWTALGASSEADAIYGGKILRDANLVGVCGAWRNMVYSDILWGRDFSQAELSGGDSKVILGARAAEELFGADLDGGDPAQVCGESIRVGGRNLTVVGVLTREGKNIINLYATDYSLVVPYSTAEAIAGRDALETMIAIGPGAGGRDAALGESRRILRAVRGLRSSSEDNFALNTMEDLCRETVALTGKISLIGVALAMFALLIGGFGIVNIMLVSVKERTPVIGLKMALGATRRRILREFLCEAVLLSTLGAALGLLLAAALVALIPSGAIEACIRPHHIAEAFAIALALGLVSGLAPAAAASRLNPVEALRS